MSSSDRPTPESFRTYIKRFKSLSGLATGLGVAAPVAASLIDATPPLFSQLRWFAPAIAAAGVIIAYYYEAPVDSESTALPPNVRLARRLLILTAIAFVAYLFVLQATTLSDSRGEQRFQIGFGRAGWSLTPEGRAWKAGHPTQTIEEWMLSFGAFRPGGSTLIWEEWSIWTAGFTGVVLYLGTFLMWTFAWALLAKKRPGS